MITLDSLDLQKTSDSELGELLIEAKKAYYTGGKPIMDDHTYDTLEAILRQKNPYHRLFEKVGTPNFNTGFTKKPHLLPMGSQNKATSYAELVKYFELKKIPVSTDFVTQPKIDGLSLEIVYKNGQLVEAITRGDGETGDVVTQNVVKMQNFVLSLSKSFTGSIRCEIVVTYKDFKRLNAIAGKNNPPSLSQREGRGGILYSNPRNAASGITQRLDGKFSELCTLYAVDILSRDARSCVSTEQQKITLLKSFGLTTVETHLCRNLAAIDQHFQEFLSQKRLNYPYEIDGLVVKINDLALQQSLGSLDGRPKGQVAYKFPAQSRQTRILAIDWQVGPLGTITPVAKVEPILVSGATINFASLANFGLIKEKNLNIGDIVEISRRGDVIPHIEKVVSKVTPGHAKAPTHCPVCHTKIITDHKFLKCPNLLTCPAQTLGILRLFCVTLDIKGISDKTIEKLHSAGKLNLPGDFYDLIVADFLDLDGLGQKSGQNIIHEIQAKKILSLVEVFDAANIPNFSAKRIRLLIKAGFDTPQKLLNLKLSDFDNLKGFKPTLAEKIITGIGHRRKVIKSILSHVSIYKSYIINPKSNLSDLSFVITGTLSVPRKDIEKLVTDNGGNLQSAVSSTTDYLIANSPSDSDKYQTAKKLNIKIITEDTFQKLLS